MTLTLCRKCGVQLDDGMDVCPLCETPVKAAALPDAAPTKPRARKPTNNKKQLLRQILWQVTAVLLLSGILATLAINLSIHGTVTWSIYPVTICLILFAYAGFMALWHTSLVLQLLVGWLAAAGMLAAVHAYIYAPWPLRLALPLLSALNASALLFIFLLRGLRAKGLNILAILFVCLTILCMMTEGIIDHYFLDAVRLQWSVIVAACLLPVTVAILFMYFRTKNNRDLQKIFHT